MDGQLGVGVSGNVTELQPLVRVACLVEPILHAPLPAHHLPLRCLRLSAALACTS